MSDVLIKVDNVSKKFCRDLKKSLWYGVKDVAGEITGWGDSKDELRPGEFWSVNDVSFELKRGECLGLIGPNGAGKSTLLKMLNGLIKPDKGRISMRGRVGALIELGAGFNPILTGRENIYVNGAVLGLTKEEIGRKFDEIVEFAEIEEFLDTPVQNYSSGMKVRLGFAVAARLEPDVLLIDEVLAVGDIGFRSKCYSKIADLVKRSAVIFVSHQMPQVAKLCDKVIVQRQGLTKFLGKTHEGIQLYNNMFGEQETKTAGTGEAKIHNIKIKSGAETDIFKYNDSFHVKFDLEVNSDYETYIISLGIMGQDGSLIAQCHSKYNNTVFKNDGRKNKITLVIEKLMLNPGTYYLNIIVFDEGNNKHLLWIYAAKEFIVKGDFFGGCPIQLDAAWRMEAI